MNRQSFDTSSPNGRKHFQKLLDTLLDYNSDENEEYYNDIHIYQEESLIIMEWDHIPYSHEWGGRFQYIDYDDVVMKEVNFPDNHYEYLFPDEVEETLKEWHEKHPEWVKSQWGTWTNMEENRCWSIDCNLDKWKSGPESEPFSKQEVAVQDRAPVGLSPEETGEYYGSISDALLNSAKPNAVLQRTGFIVVGSKAAKYFFNNVHLKRNKDFYLGEENEDGAYVSKMGVLNLSWQIQEPWQKEPEDFETKIHIYYVRDVKDEIMFVTDTNYLLHKIKVIDAEDPDSGKEDN